MRRGVALRKESVDRNRSVQQGITGMAESLSARRAWIEIARITWRTHKSMVALRKESVDRNHWNTARRLHCLWSLSARRAWIEICAVALPRAIIALVALRKESVDRNARANKAL